MIILTNLSCKPEVDVDGGGYRLPRLGIARLLCLMLLTGAFLVLGNDRSEADVGLASWYSPEFEGRQTASGETYDPNGYTAAHNSLPLGTGLVVSYGERSVPVRVNDRGPFLGTRKLDLSQAAARDLGLTPEGVGYVGVRGRRQPRGGSLASGSANTRSVATSGATARVSQGVAEQPYPSQGTAQQPALTQGALQQPEPLQGAAQQPRLSQGATQQPTLSRGTAEQELPSPQGAAQEGPAFLQGAAQLAQPTLSQGVSQRPNPVQEAGQQSSPLPRVTQQPGLTQPTEDPRPPTRPGLLGEAMQQPELAQGTTQRPDLSQGPAQQPQLKQGAAQQPALSQGIAQQPGTSQEAAGWPGLSQRAAQQPALSQGVAQEPGIAQGAVQQPGLSQGLAQQPGLAKPSGGYRAGYLSYPSGYLAAQDKASGGTYVVQPGDTLGQIAAQLGIPADHLARYNGITDPNIIHSGQPLYFLSLENAR